MLLMSESYKFIFFNFELFTFCVNEGIHKFAVASSSYIKNVAESKTGLAKSEM